MRRRYGAALIMSFITVCSHFDYKFCSVVWFYTSEQGTRRAEGWRKCRGAEESGGKRRIMKKERARRKKSALTGKNRGCFVDTGGRADI